ncbi:MAG TPA: glycogen synthase [Fibrobacteria bacterium]|nr:glycogen synthase [Fibrobacteria bacterium]
MKILFVASESHPYVTTGGLAGVVGSLPKALARLGHEVRICIPLYSRIDRQRHGVEYRQNLCVHMGTGEVWCGLHEADHGDGVRAWFIDHGDMFGRPGVYDQDGQPYLDNNGRFAFLGKAALQACKDTGWIPDVLHAHDWQGAPAIAFRKTWDSVLSPLSATATVLTIHNLAYQGQGDKSVMHWMGMGPEHFTAEKFEDHGGVNLLKAGVHFADAITTVSPTYAHEIQGEIGGQGLHAPLRRRSGDLFGILNGIDPELYDPSADKFLPATFSPADLSGRAACRLELQRRMGLAEDPTACIVSVVSRLAPGKGFELIEPAMERAIGGMHIQFVLVGSGNRHYEWWVGDLQRRHPGRVGNWIGYREDLAHLVYAGSDLYLMPSLFEPCGLSQMYAMRYGTLPVVRRTGGLADTVWNYIEHDGGGDGFVFDDYRVDSLYYTLGWAVSTYFDRPDHFLTMRRRVMGRDFSWETSARHYVDAYHHALAKVR